MSHKARDPFCLQLAISRAKDFYMIQDLNKKQESLRKILPVISDLIDADQLAMGLVILRAKNGGISVCRFIGPESSCFEALGACEYLKDVIKMGDHAKELGEQI